MGRAPPPEIRVTEEADPDGPRPPAGSAVLVERHAGGVTLTVPPAGLRGGAPGALLLVGGALVGVAVAVLVRVPDGQGAAAVCGLVGLGTATAAVSMGRRRATLAVAGDALTVLEVGLLWSRRRAWPRGDVADVRPGPSGIEINEEPVPQLQIHTRGGRTFGLMTGRDPAELAWMGRVLRAALGVPAAAGAGVP